MTKSVYACIAFCIYEIATTDKLREVDKKYLIGEDLIKSSGEDDKSNEIVDELIDFGFDMFRRPFILFTTDPKFIKDDSIIRELDG